MSRDGRIRTSQIKGGKFNLNENKEKEEEGPTPSTYFGLGRSELNTVNGVKFDRTVRHLPGDYWEKPDYDNVLFHKDKGPGVKKKIKGAFFPQADEQQLF